MRTPFRSHAVIEFDNIGPHEDTQYRQLYAASHETLDAVMERLGLACRHECRSIWNRIDQDRSHFGAAPELGRVAAQTRPSAQHCVDSGHTFGRQVGDFDTRQRTVIGVEARARLGPKTIHTEVLWARNPDRPIAGTAEPGPDSQMPATERQEA